MDSVKYIEELFYKYRDRCYSLFLSIFNYNHELSKDMVQELFLRLLQKKDILNIENIDSYIYNMCKNLAYDHFRKEGSKTKYLMNKSFNERERLQNPSLFSIEAVIERNLQLKIAEKRVETLPVQQQTIFILNKRDGLSIKEIAAKLGLSPNTVRNHLYRAIKSLRNS